ncbi:MAG TPA: NRDE family protein [Candidatus Eisenbacteria bacterium]|nr:NRDE family protein [Candidatus Eisenbacteria bacterium]
MCTLIVGREILGPGTLLVGANRDESPGRPSSGPARLRERPPVVGGRDLVAGGTWLAVREARFVAALLNRRPAAAGGPGGTGARAEATGDAGHGDAAAPLRSRGLLCIDAAASPPGFDAPAALDPATGEPYPARLDAALRIVGRDRYAPCSLVGLEAGGPSWVIALRPDEAPRASLLAPGWHVITHAEMDDAEEPRTRALLARLEGERPRGVEEGFELLAGLLRHHGDSAIPAVCLHRDRFPTVSSTLLALGTPGAARYAHAGGPPCVTPYEDFSALLG